MVSFFGVTDWQYYAVRCKRLRAPSWRHDIKPHSHTSIAINRRDGTLAALLGGGQHGLRAMLSPPRLRALCVAFNAVA